MLIAVCSLKGSPGVTTTALALGARWPDTERPIVVEADPGGGDLLARFRLTEGPGLVTLAVAARRSDDPTLLAQHTQQLPGGLLVAPGPVGAEQTRSALITLAGPGRNAVLRRAADAAGWVVIVDCGRVDPDSAALPVIRSADAMLLLARPRDEDLAHVALKLDVAARWTPHPALVLVGEGYPIREVSRVLGVEVMGRLPHDPMGAAVLRGRSGRQTPARSALGKAAARLAVLTRAQIHLRPSEMVASSDAARSSPGLAPVPSARNGVRP